MSLVLRRAVPVAVVVPLAGCGDAEEPATPRLDQVGTMTVEG